MNENLIMQPTIKQINATNSIDELEEVLNLEFTTTDISHRGGGLALNGSDVADLLEIDSYLLPNSIGAFCNYLGGGLRGAISPSTYSSEIPKSKVGILDAILNACVRIYEFLEDTSGLNDEGTDDNPNWEAIGTSKSRQAGVVSAY